MIMSKLLVGLRIREAVCSGMVTKIKRWERRIALAECAHSRIGTQDHVDEKCVMRGRGARESRADRPPLGDWSGNSVRGSIGITPRKSLVTANRVDVVVFIRSIDRAWHPHG
jgi:hypothetical protein